MKENIDLIDLRAAKIKVTVNLNRISFIKKNKKDFKKHKGKEIGISLLSSQIGDAIYIDQGKKINYLGLVAEEIGDVTFIFIDRSIAKETDEQSSQIDYINMSDVQANGLVFYVNPKIANEIKNYRIFRIFHRASDAYTQLPVQNNYFFGLGIGLQNATIKTISIVANSEKLEETSNNKGDKSDFSCKMKLGGFNYSQLDTTAFKFLTICVDSLYRNATRLTDTLADQPDQQKKQQEEANRQLIQLLQPIEKLSVVSKSLGVSGVEKEMMYRQKKLEYYLAKTNLSQSQSNFWKSIYSDQNLDDLQIQLGEIFISSWTLVSNIFQDAISGYGFHRLKIFYIIIPILILNFFWALFVSYQKQKKNAYESWYFKTKEIEDEKIGDYSLKQEPLTLQAVSQDIDTILQVIFESYDAEQDYFYLYFKYDNENNYNYNSYKRIKLDRQEFKYLIGILDNRNPTHTKVGFCKNYYPKGKWSVVTKIEPESPQEIKEVREISIYIIEHEKLISDMNFESINPLKVPTRITLSTLKYFVDFLKSLFKKQLEDMNQSELKALGNKKSSETDKEGLLKRISEFSEKRILSNPFVIKFVITPLEWITEFCKRWIFFNPLVITLIITPLFIVLIPFLIIIWHGKKVQGILSWFGFLVVYQGIIISLILSFILFKIAIFSFREDENLAWITRKNLANAVLFSFDILIPIIELDKENLDFILDAAEEHTLIRIYFRMEKLIGPLLVSVLLPLLLLTGL